MKDTFTVSEVSTIFGISVQTLHYYDRIGIFCPQARGDNGYRLYLEAQFYKLSTIRFQQKLGKSLAQIQSYFDSNETTPLADLSRQLDTVDSQIKKLRRIETMIKNKYRYTQENLQAYKDHVQKYGKDGFSIEHHSQRKYLDMKIREFSYDDEIFYSYPTMVIYDGKEIEDLKDFCLYCPYGEVIYSNPHTEVCFVPEGDFLTGYLVGTYLDIWDVFEQMYDYAGKNGLSVEKTIYTFNIMDLFVVPKISDFVTLIEMKLK